MERFSEVKKEECLLIVNVQYICMSGFPLFGAFCREGIITHAIGEILIFCQRAVKLGYFAKASCLKIEHWMG